MYPQTHPFYWILNNAGDREMTAYELIERLKALPPETPVLVEGYETGYDDIVSLNTQDVIQLHNVDERDGEYNFNANEQCSNREHYTGLNGLLSHVVPDPRFDDEESRDSAIYKEGDNVNCAEKMVLSAVIILGRRGNLR